MKKYKLAESEEKFAKLIWDNEPIASGELVKLCDKELNWKKSTTYTVLKKLCDKEILENNNAIVTALVSKDEYYENCSVTFVEDTFGGSLPKFIAAFIGGSKISKSEAEQLNNTFFF